jgi:hypothetical protein
MATFPTEKPPTHLGSDNNMQRYPQEWVLVIPFSDKALPVAA